MYVEGLTIYQTALGDSKLERYIWTKYLPDCAEVLFPTVLGGLLPNLHRLAFDIRHKAKSVANGDNQLIPRTGTATGETAQKPVKRHIDCLPTHPRFPLILSSFSESSRVTELALTSVVFQTFNNFARLLHAFKKLRSLRCDFVHWRTKGILLPSFMRTTTSGPRSDGAFLPCLANFEVSRFSCRQSMALLPSGSPDRRLPPWRSATAPIGPCSQWYRITPYVKVRPS